MCFFTPAIGVLAKEKGNSYSTRALNGCLVLTGVIVETSVMFTIGGEFVFMTLTALWLQKIAQLTGLNVTQIRQLKELKIYISQM